MYEPFGTLFSTTVNGVRQAFTGQEWDASSDLYYYNARYYSASLGRFVQPDTLLDGLNRYSYCGNDPVNFNDPTGMFTFSPAPGVSVDTNAGTVSIAGTASTPGYTSSAGTPYHGPGVDSSRNGQPFIGFDNGRALYSLPSTIGYHLDHNVEGGIGHYALDGQINSDAGQPNNSPDDGDPVGSDGPGYTTGPGNPLPSDLAPRDGKYYPGKERTYYHKVGGVYDKLSPEQRKALLDILDPNLDEITKRSLIELYKNNPEAAIDLANSLKAAKKGVDDLNELLDRLNDPGKTNTTRDSQAKGKK